MSRAANLTGQPRPQLAMVAMPEGGCPRHVEGQHSSCQAIVDSSYRICVGFVCFATYSGCGPCTQAWPRRRHVDLILSAIIDPCKRLFRCSSDMDEIPLAPSSSLFQSAPLPQGRRDRSPHQRGTPFLSPLSIHCAIFVGTPFARQEIAIVVFVEAKAP